MAQPILLVPKLGVNHPPGAVAYLCKLALMAKSECAPFSVIKILDILTARSDHSSFALFNRSSCPSGDQ